MTDKKQVTAGEHGHMLIIPRGGAMQHEDYLRFRKGRLGRYPAARRVDDRVLTLRGRRQQRQQRPSRALQEQQQHPQLRLPGHAVEDGSVEEQRRHLHSRGVL